MCYELYQDITQARKALESQSPKSSGVLVSGLTRLQRSCISDSVAGVARDSTVGAARFLVGVLQAVESYIRIQLQSPGLWKVKTPVVGPYDKC